MRRTFRLGAWCAALVLVSASTLFAQSSVKKESGWVATADCATSSQCLSYGLLDKSIASVTIDLDLNGSTGTYVAEVRSRDDTPWRAYPGLEAITASGSYLLQNAGYHSMRLRPSSLPGGQPIVAITRGFGLAADVTTGDIAIPDVEVVFPTAADANAVAVRCVNAAGSAFAECGGGAGGGGLTDTELRATPVPVSGTVATGALTNTELRATAVPVSGPLTDTQLRATAVPVSGTVTATGPLTDTQLRATAVPVSGTVTATGPLTDTQLRATPVPVSGTVTTGGLTDTQLRATAVPVSGPLTDSQLRATAVPVSGTVTATGPLTDTQLRATAVPVSLASAPLPTGAATETSLASLLSVLQGLDHAEDSPHTTAHLGMMPLFVRQDTQSALAADGDYLPGTIGADGGIRTSLVGAFASGVTVTNTTAGMPAQFRACDTAAFISGIDAGELFVPCGYAGAQATYLLDVATGQPYAAAVDYAEDAAHVSGSTGPAPLNLRTDVPASSASATGEYALTSSDSLGLTWVRPYNPCSGPTTTVPVSLTADVAVITAGGSGVRNWICGGVLSAPGTAEILNIWEGTTTTTPCDTSSAAVVGSTTEANGVTLGASGGGFAIMTPIRGIGTNVNTCIRVSGSNRVAGWLSIAQTAF